jgi:hypothetical protein
MDSSTSAATTGRQRTAIRRRNARRLPSNGKVASGVRFQPSRVSVSRMFMLRHDGLIWDTDIPAPASASSSNFAVRHRVSGGRRLLPRTKIEKDSRPSRNRIGRASPNLSGTLADGPGCVHRRRQRARRLIIRARSVSSVRHGRANTQRKRGDNAEHKNFRGRHGQSPFTCRVTRLLSPRAGGSVLSVQPR